MSSWALQDAKAKFSAVVERWGFVSVQAGSKGVAIPVLDGWIAATALVHGMTVVTRNVSDVQASDARVFSPWPC